MIYAKLFKKARSYIRGNFKKGFLSIIFVVFMAKLSYISKIFLCKKLLLNEASNLAGNVI